jgi:hypothetical protein
MKSSLQRDFKGKNLSAVDEYFSSLPSTKVPMENGKTKIIYSKEEQLRSTTINQGTNTLDPINSPSVVKTEQFIFVVDENGTIIDTQYKSGYKKPWAQ